jgi:CheY-like chemotaxis protein
VRQCQSHPRRPGTAAIEIAPNCTCGYIEIARPLVRKTGLSLDAFRNAQRLQEPFDIVITDLGMPNVDGRQVITGVRSASPATPIILLTGWSQHMASDDPALQANRLLGKPPRLTELRTAIAELTAAPGE